jgi:hypothetical protein
MTVTPYVDTCNMNFIQFHSRKDNTEKKLSKSSNFTRKVGIGWKDTLVICNSIFPIFLNQIKAQRDQKSIVWIEYFPYKYSFKVISND